MAIFQTGSIYVCHATTNLAAPYPDVGPLRLFKAIVSNGDTTLVLQELTSLGDASPSPTVTGIGADDTALESVANATTSSPPDYLVVGAKARDIATACPVQVLMTYQHTPDVETNPDYALVRYLPPQGGGPYIPGLWLLRANQLAAL